MPEITFNPKLFLKTVPHQPGVYCIYNRPGEVIYVGKAKDLHQRLSSYFCQCIENRKTEALVRAIAEIQITVTHNETEALLLEQNRIKHYRPRYNVLLRDDKAYPYLLLTHGKYPRLMCHHGAKRVSGDYFGPFTKTKAVYATLALLQKLFLLRQCTNTVYHNRTRPCLQYQMHRCLAPCIPGLVDEARYQQHVNDVRLFLQGKSQQVLTRLIQRMEHASQTLQYETAAQIRDQIQAIRQVVEKQFVTNSHLDNLDVISVAYEQGIAVVHVLFLRHGNLLGSRSYYPQVPQETTLNEVVHTFVSQFYLQGNQNRDLPDYILLDFLLENCALFTASLKIAAQRTIHVQCKPRGTRANYLQLARTNAISALHSRLAHHTTMQQRFHSLEQTVQLPDITRLECFDISHTMGKQPIAACVVFNQQGALKTEYRRYPITAITPGDDCAAIAHALKRRYTKMLSMEKIPDVIIIDGGKSQLKRAMATLSELPLLFTTRLPILLAVAKGVERKVGQERLLIAPAGEEIHLLEHSPARHLIQQIRDEAHNHALTGHRQHRSKAHLASCLEQIEGIGPKRRQLLLKYMGGLKPLFQATIEEIARVPSISPALAEKIYYHFKTC